MGKAITSFDRINFGDSQSIYVLRDDVNDIHDNINVRALGFIKVGYKPLFVIDAQGKQFEVRPLCILDFYVVEEMQRQGCGKALFDHMIHDLKLRPAQLAVDRPSAKFKSFLRKHYGLVHTIPQVNNFVIFDGFFRYNNPKRQRNRLTDDFSDRRRYQHYVKNQNSRRLTESALPRLNPKVVSEHKSSEQVCQKADQIEHKHELEKVKTVTNQPVEQPISINRNVTSDPLLHKRKPCPPPPITVDKMPHQFAPRLRDENYGAFLAQWHPRNNARHRSNHSNVSARHYSRHNSAFKIFGLIDKHH